MNKKSLSGHTLLVSSPISHLRNKHKQDRQFLESYYIGNRIGILQITQYKVSRLKRLQKI